jgi:hypothetical protein
MKWRFNTVGRYRVRASNAKVMLKKNIQQVHVHPVNRCHEIDPFDSNCHMTLPRAALLFANDNALGGNFVRVHGTHTSSI